MKHFIGILCILCGAIAIVAGAAMPFFKAQSYIDAMAGVRGARQLGDALAYFDSAFGMRSPVGDPELAKFISGDVAGMIAGQESEGIARALANYIEPKLDRTDVRHLMTGAQICALLWEKFKNKEDYAHAAAYYEAALAISPDMVPTLYSAFEFYAKNGDTANMRRIGDRILKNWPNDPTVPAAYAAATTAR